MNFRKVFILSCILSISFLHALSPANPYYKGTSKAIERVYSLPDGRLKGTLVITAKNVIEYNRDGSQRTKSLYEPNEAYKGKIVYSYEPAQQVNMEITYNAMNQATHKKQQQYLSSDVDYIMSRYSGNNELIEKTISMYDSLQHRRTETYYNSFGEVDSYSVFSTDNLGTDLDKHCFDEEGNLISSMTLSYNEKGFVEEANEFDRSGKLLDTIDYQYDPHGNLTNMVCCAPDGVSYKRESYMYDIKGRLLQYDLYENVDVFDATIRLKESRKYEYINSKK